MAYQLLIPPAFAAAYAAGEVALMTTATGATTTLVGTSGAIVGTATLVETAGAGAGVAVAGGGGAAGAPATAASAAALALPIALTVGGVLLVGGGAWYTVQRIRKAKRAAHEPVVVEVADGVDPDEALREAQAIVDSEFERLNLRGDIPVVRIREIP